MTVTMFQGVWSPQGFFQDFPQGGANQHSQNNLGGGGGHHFFFLYNMCKFH